MLIIIQLVLLSVCIHGAGARSENLANDPVQYLKKFGYISQEKFQNGVPIDAETLKVGLEEFQLFANLKVTGGLNQETLDQMKKARCGNEDSMFSFKRHRGRRFNPQGTKWNNKNLLTWKLDGRGRTLTRDTVRRVLNQAFNLWSEQTNMDFVETSGNADIDIKFTTGDHGDGYPFHGQGGVLAHAFYPLSNTGIAGDVHFDDAEDYTLNSAEGKNLLFVATHEIGHSLGLLHSNVAGAVMQAFIPRYAPGLQLTRDDILGVQSLYGVRGATTTARPVCRDIATSSTCRTWISLRPTACSSNSGVRRDCAMTCGVCQ